MSFRDPHGNRMRIFNEQFPPRLRKNRKIELRWGNDYYEAINMAVFSNKYGPYMPSEPPVLIREDVDKTGYVCKQCRDCFRFLSSIEEHTSRRSWILGYWCQACFATKCTHAPKDRPMCLSCSNIEGSKHAYLAEKGIRRNFKKGVTRVFYNQCQFFAHLRMHGTIVVDLSEIMLMPLPSSVKNDDWGQLDRLCKALMETMFIRRTHIMDWLSEMNIKPNRWDTLQSWMESKKKTPITDILARYSEDCVNPVELAARTRQSKPIKINVAGKKSKNPEKPQNNEKDPLADDAGNDIAFVDCGPTPSHVILSEFPSVLAEKDSSNSKPADRANSLWRSFSQQYDKLKDKSVDSQTKISAELSQPPPATIHQRQNPRVLTIRSPKSLSLSTIMKHLPIDGIINNKKVVVVAENINEENTLTPHAPKNRVVLDSKSDEKIAEDKDEMRKTMENSDSSTSSTSNQIGKPLLTKSQSFSEQMSLHGRVVFQNGRKYIIKHITKSKPRSILQDSIAVKQLRNSLPPVPIVSNLKLILPKPVKETTKISSNVDQERTKISPKSGEETTKISLKDVDETTKISHKLAEPTTKKVPLKLVEETTKKIPLKLVEEMTKIPSKFNEDTRKILPPSIQETPSISTENETDKSHPPESTGRPPRKPKISPKSSPISGFSLTTSKANLTSQNNKARVTKMQKSLMIKCREVMMSDLYRVNKSELDSYIAHLRGINELYAKTMNFQTDSVLTNNIKAIKSFENVANSGIIKNNIDDSYVTDAFEKTTREWEMRIKETDKLRTCDTCRKRVKPPSYVIGMSGPAKDETIFCQCYNNICYICNANQGSLIQLKAHIKWHKGEKPFMCPSCSIIFATSTELEIHVWTSCFHPMARHIYGCGVCEIEGILDMESIAKHFLLLHTRRKIICAECKMEYTGNAPTYTDYTKHFIQHHPDIKNITEPKRLLVCTLKQCIIRPELFRAHLSDHIGVLKWIYYKCPFCTTITQGSGRNKSLMREHLIDNHMDRMHEIVSAESLPRILDGIRLISANIAPMNDRTGEVSNVDPNGPKILDARTITSATFEHGSEATEGRIDDPTVPKISDVRSEAGKVFGLDETRMEELELEILTVKSMEGSSSSPAMRSERGISRAASEDLAGLRDKTETITLRVNSQIGRDLIEGEDSSNSRDEIDLMMMETDTKNETNLARESSCLFETYDENPRSKGFPASQLKALLLQKSEPRRPWRIALNSPTTVEVEPVDYNCHLCGELINTSWSVIKTHFESHHSRDYEIFRVTPKIPRISMDFIDGGYREDSSGKKRKPEVVTAPGPKRRKRWSAKKHIERPGSPSHGICVRPEPVQEIEGNFRCKKCDELFKDISMLREHIATIHRIKGQYLICLECGENFVVSPSLQMHLKALHGIQDPITYLSQNTAYAPDTLDDMEEDEKATEANQCYVCMAVFEDKPALDKHMRVHGMAFLRRKRFEAQKALKCAIKNNSSLDGNPATGSPEIKTNNGQKDRNIWAKTKGSLDGNSSAGSTRGKSNNNQNYQGKSIMEIIENETLRKIS